MLLALEQSRTRPNTRSSKSILHQGGKCNSHPKTPYPATPTHNHIYSTGTSSEGGPLSLRATHTHTVYLPYPDEEHLNRPGRFSPRPSSPKSIRVGVCRFIVQKRRGMTLELDATDQRDDDGPAERFTYVRLERRTHLALPSLPCISTHVETAIALRMKRCRKPARRSHTASFLFSSSSSSSTQHRHRHRR